MHQLVVRNGRMVDGTGVAARHADIAIDTSGVVAEIGNDVGRGDGQPTGVRPGVLLRGRR